MSKVLKKIFIFSIKKLPKSGKLPKKGELPKKGKTGGSLAKIYFCPSRKPTLPCDRISALIFFQLVGGGLETCWGKFSCRLGSQKKVRGIATQNTTLRPKATPLVFFSNLDISPIFEKKIFTICFNVVQ